MSFAIAIAVIAGLALLIRFLFGLHKKQQAELQATLMQAGFQAIPQLDGSLTGAISGMAGRSGKTDSIRNIYKYAGLNYDLYRYDVSGDDSVDTRYVMDFRRDFFPPFVAFPYMKLPGFLNGIVSKLFQMALGRSDLKEIDVPGKPRFREKYRLYGKESHILLSAIPADVWDRLAEMPGFLCISGEGRLLLLTAAMSKEKPRANHPIKDVRRMVEVADALWRVFGELRPQRLAV